MVPQGPLETNQAKKCPHYTNNPKPPSGPRSYRCAECERKRNCDRQRIRRENLPSEVRQAEQRSDQLLRKNGFSRRKFLTTVALGFLSKAVPVKSMDRSESIPERLDTLWEDLRSGRLMAARGNALRLFRAVRSDESAEGARAKMLAQDVLLDSAEWYNQSVSSNSLLENATAVAKQWYAMGEPLLCIRSLERAANFQRIWGDKGRSQEFLNLAFDLTERKGYRKHLGEHAVEAFRFDRERWLYRLHPAKEVVARKRIKELEKIASAIGTPESGFEMQVERLGSLLNFCKDNQSSFDLRKETRAALKDTRDQFDALPFPWAADELKLFRHEIEFFRRIGDVDKAIEIANEFLDLWAECQEAHEIERFQQLIKDLKMSHLVTIPNHGLLFYCGSLPRLAELYFTQEQRVWGLS